MLTKVLREYAQLLVGLGLVGLLVLGFVLAGPGDREPRSSSDHVAPDPSTVTLTPEPEVVEEPVGVLQGQVSDESGRPVAGVRVSAASAPFVPVEMRHGYAPAGQVHTVNTDAEGRYRFDELPVGTYRVGTGGGATVVWYPSGAHVLAGEDVVVKEKATTRLDLERAAPASVAGTVRVPEGQTYDVQLEQRVARTPERLSGWVQVRARGQRRDYEFAGLPAGDYRVSVAASGSGRVLAPAATAPRDARVVRLEAGESVTDVDVDVPMPFVLTGRVTTSAGTAVAGHEFRLMTGWTVADPRFPAVPTVTETVTTDNSGGYRIALPTAVWAIDLESCGIGVRPHLRVRAAAGQARVRDFTTDAVGSVSGRVTRPDGRPYARVQVSALAPGDSCAHSTRTDRDGRWTVTGVGPGAVRIDYGVTRAGAFMSYLHPGVTEQADLVTVEVGLDADRTGVEAVLPVK
ncbi:carboxypeptidase regulatory-like domain-containing protein [Nocardioides sp. Y6]|uniref:Carboxypeptidase regulatory-like domain-containing protein n=1 Tax=Nocardioides malaquae TaxID=2773426 RepID=A0ABR9RRB8_9ACTN|nr:carboxypeptidase-like regulatory domain-containing protein [Nocardioides malaquae]MBE7323945.1 carboxypeptidase regulatory-like domain-containing protein [Nocardioides malaquae]